MRSASRLGKRLLLASASFLLTGLVVEAVASTVAYLRWWDASFLIFEDSGRTCRFDASRGYRLSKTPSRFLRVTDGRVEYVGTLRGNSQGFPDRDDFEPRRPEPGARRIAVFGDSFTEAQYLGQNWPDRAEDLARGRGEPLSLLNFGISGGGLANWWQILSKVVGPENYEIDGVIFAVYAGDLRRTFTVWDHSTGAHPLFGRAPGWGPGDFPATLAQARSFLKPHPSHIVSPSEFERAVQGHWPPSVPRRFRPFLLGRVRRLVSRPQGELTVEPFRRDEPDRGRLIEAIRRFLADRRIPALVVSVPDRASLLDPSRAPTRLAGDAEAFAAAIGAAYLDGSRAFAGLKPVEIRGSFLPVDGHWNQSGSNRFAEFLLRNLSPVVTRGAKRACR